MPDIEEKRSSTTIPKELREKSQAFLNDKLKANNVVDIIEQLEKNLNNKQPVAPIILTLENIFSELLKRREFGNDDNDQCDEEEVAKAVRDYCCWLKERYEETLALMLRAMECENTADKTQALSSGMKLLAVEGMYPLSNSPSTMFPIARLKAILEKLLSEQFSQQDVIQCLQEYAQYVDVVHHSWCVLYRELMRKSTIKNEISFLNLMDVINALPVSKALYSERKYFVKLETEKKSCHYFHTRKSINKLWNNIMEWISADMSEKVHKQLLIILLERFLSHLEKPILLTDFLMDSLDFGGAISLLALQGVFILIRKHNITYPNIYEKLYSLFEPDIFYTKYKARLFYLADIFLSSTHLPENLVAAFAKRLARLSLTAPPHDIIIMMQFIGNLILRHPGLKKLIHSETCTEVDRDPYNMLESDPIKSNAMDSSFWEILALQKHCLPAVAIAAKFISRPLPKHEWNLSDVLELKEEDMFDQEINKKRNRYALSLERPSNLFLPENDKFQKHWSLI